MPGRRKSTQTQADKDLSEQVINLGTSTRPIITTVPHNKKGSVTSSPPRSSSSSSIYAQVDVVLSETSLSPLRRSKRKRDLLDDAEYNDTIEQPEVAPASFPPHPPPISARSTAKSYGKPKPPFLRKLEEYTSKKAKGTVVRWSKDGTRLYIFEKEQMRKDLKELRWLAHSQWGSMEAQLWKHGFFPVHRHAYTEVEQELHTQGTGLAVYHSKDYTFDHHADYSYSESADSALNFAATIACNTNRAERQAMKDAEYVPTSTIGERLRMAAAAAPAKPSAKLPSRPPSIASPALEVPEAAISIVNTPDSPQQDLEATEDVQADHQSAVAAFPPLRPAKLAALTALKEKPTKSLPRGEDHWAAKAKKARLLREAQARAQAEAGMSALASQLQGTAVPSSRAIGDLVESFASLAGRKGSSAIARGTGTSRGRGSGRGRGRGRGRVTSSVAQVRLSKKAVERGPAEDDTSEKAVEAVTKVEEPPEVAVAVKGRGRWPRKTNLSVKDEAAHSNSASTRSPSTEADGVLTRRSSLRNLEDCSTFSSRYPRACRPTRNEMMDIAEDNEDTEEELYLLFEDDNEDEVTERPKKRCKTGRTAASRKEEASVEPIEPTAEEREDMKVLKERLGRELSRGTRATSSSTTLVSEDFTSPPRTKHHLRTPTSLSPAARTSSLPPVKESDDLDYIASSPLTGVDSGLPLLRPASNRIHLPTPASLSPFPSTKAEPARAQDAPPSPLTDIDDLDNDQDEEGVMNFDEAGKIAKLEEIERQDELFARKLFGYPEAAEPARDVTPAQCQEIMIEDEIAQKESPLEDDVAQLHIIVAPARDITPAEEGAAHVSTLSVPTAPEKQKTPTPPSPVEDRRPEPPGPAIPETADAQLSCRDADIVVPLDEDEVMVEELFLINKPADSDLERAAFPLGRQRSSHNLSYCSNLADSTGMLNPESKTLRRASDVSQVFGSQGLYNFGSPKTGQSILLLDLQVEIPEIESLAAEQEEQVSEAISTSLQEELPSLSQESPSAYFGTPQGSPSDETVIPLYTASSSNIVASSEDAEPGLYGPFCNWADSKLLSYEDSSMYLEFNVEGAAYTMENGERLLLQFSGVDVPRPRHNTLCIHDKVVDEGYRDDFSAMLKNLMASLPKDAAEKQTGRESRAGSEDTVEDDSMRLSAPAGSTLVFSRDLSKKTCDPFLFEAHPGPALDFSKVRKQVKLHRRQTIADMRLVELEKRRSVDDGSLPPSPPQYDYENVRPVTRTSLDTMIGELEATEPRIIRKVSLTEQAEREEKRNTTNTSKTATFKSPILVRAGASSATKSTKAAAARAKALAELDKNSQQRKSRSGPPMKEKRQYTKKRSIQQDEEGDSEHKDAHKATFKTPRLTTPLNPPEETREDAVQARPTSTSSRNRPSMRNKRILNAVSKAGR